MKKILYIHGLKRGSSTTESRTAQVLRNALDERHYIVIAPTFPTDAPKALHMAQQLIQDETIDLVVASSLGGFIALSLQGVKKIVINPCIRPDLELPKRGNAEVASTYCELITTLWHNITPEEQKQTIGIFSDNDELFSYRTEFLQHYTQAIDIHDGHRISEENVREVIIKMILNTI